MSFTSWLQNLTSRRARQVKTNPSVRRLLRGANRRLGLEPLEDRRLLAFSPVTSFPVAIHPAAVATGDFNNDAVPDLVTADSGGVSVLLGNGNGTFQPARSSATGPWPQSVAVGDFNQDGLLDLVTANDDSGADDNDISILLGHGDGTFDAAIPLSYGSSYSSSIATGDLNTDGKLDLVVVSNDYEDFAGIGVSVLLGQGDGNFAPATTYGPFPQSLSSVALADVNRDGHADVVVPDWNSVNVLLGNGDGTLQQPRDFATDYGPESAAIGDFNADGKLDLATANYSNSVNVLLGNGDGTFRTAKSYAAGEHPESAGAADINGDGFLDLIVAHPGSTSSSDGAVSVLLGLGDGSFAPPITTDTRGSYATSVAVADFNGDGRLDAAAANMYSDNVSVLINDGIWAVPSLPRISISDVTKVEGKKGKTTLFVFTVTLSTASDQPVTMSYRTVNGTATTSDSDYIAKTGTLTFAPGETTKTITITVKGDSKREGDETFYLDLFGLSSNALFTKNRGIGTVLNDD